MNRILFALLLLALASGCGGGGGNNNRGTIALLVTDAPVPFESVRSATVEIDRITIDGGPYALGPARILYQGAPIAIDVCNLRNGIASHILSRKVAVFEYRRMHVHFSGAQLELTNGHQFSTADGSIQLPAGGTSGLEVTIETPLEVTKGHWSRLLLDIDLPRSFAPLGTSDLLLAQSLSFEPLVHAVRPGLTGEIRGVVSQADTQGQILPVADATLYFLPAGTEDINMAAGSTGTEADGSFAKIGLQPGTYDVVAMKAGVATTYNACLVGVGGYCVVDILLP
jgi:hypothetical protein